MQTSIGFQVTAGAKKHMYSEPPLLSEPQESVLIEGGANHQFCYVYWEHGPNSVTSLYFVDTPNPLGARAFKDFRATQDLNSFIVVLKSLGWQEYSAQANQEAYEKWLMRPPAMEPNYEYAVLTCTKNAESDQTPKLQNVYRLGEKNNNLLVEAKLLMASYDEALQYLEREKWTHDHDDEYPKFKDNTKFRVQLRYFKRPVG